MALLAGFSALPIIDVGGLSGGTSSPGRDFFNYSFPVTSDGTIETLTVEMMEAAAVGGFTLKQWRLNGTTLEFIGSSTLPALSVGVNTDSPLDTPLSVLSGDIIGIHLAQNDGRVGKVAAAADSIKWNGGSASDYVTNTDESVVSDGLAFGIAFQANGTPSGSTSLTITSPTEQERYKQRNLSNQISYTVSGSISNLPSGAVVRYSLDGGAYQTLDASPSTTFSGSITVTSTQTVTIDMYDGTTSYNSQTITLRAVAWILGDGQSNMACRGFNNQSLTLDTGAKTPVALKGSTFGIASDPMGIDSQAAGSWQMEFLSLLANANKSITYGFVNVAEGGTSVNRWIKSASDLYPRITSAFALTGGFEYAITLLGETDASNSMPQAEAETKYGSFVDDKKADFGIDTYLVNFPKINYPGNDDIRAAFASLVAGNASCFDGGDLRPLDIANTGGDGVHLQTDAQLSGAANIIYPAVSAVPNEPPVARAGADRSETAGGTATLDGSGSTDGDGTIVSYAWSQVSGTAVILQNPSTNTASFEVPSNSSVQTLVFRLTVTDDRSETHSDDVTITVPAVTATPPSVTLTTDNTNVLSGNTVDLVATPIPGSSNIVSGSWTQVSGPTVTLAGANTETLTFTAPVSPNQETLEFEYRVTDAAGTVVTSLITIIVAAAPAVRPFFINNKRNFSFFDSDGAWTDKLRFEEIDSYTLTIDPAWISPESIIDYSVTPEPGLEVISHARQDNIIQVYLKSSLVGRSKIRFDFETPSRSDHVSVAVEVVN